MQFSKAIVFNFIPRQLKFENVLFQLRVMVLDYEETIWIMQHGDIWLHHWWSDSFSLCPGIETYILLAASETLLQNSTDDIISLRCAMGMVRDIFSAMLPNV